LQECEVLFDLGLWALKNLGGLIFPLEDNQVYNVPIVQERWVSSCL
jgi:hypothetical protein